MLHLRLGASQCPLLNRVNRVRVVLAVDWLLPIYPDEQTFSVSEGMSQSGQFGAHASQQGDRDRTLPDGRFVKRACSVDRDHNVGGLDHQADAAVHLDAELVDPSLVIEDVTIFPPMSTRTCEVVAPFLTATTTPLMWLRALMRMVTYHQFSHAHSFSRSKLRHFPLGARLHRETDIALCMFGGNQIISRQPSR